MHKTAPQRYIYKIDSSRLRKARWNLNISVNEALLNDEIVSITESETIRFIDSENNTSSNAIYETIKALTKEIKSIKKELTSIENRDKIKSHYSKKIETLLCKDYVAIIIDSEKDFDRLNNDKAFFINGIRYNYLLGTSGGIKKYIIIYISDRVYNIIDTKIDNGRNPNIEFVPAKLESYKALSCSQSIPVSMPKGILVVDDCITKFTDNVVLIDDTESDEPIVTPIKNYPIELNATDGFGICLPSLSERWSKELEENYTPSGFCIRNSFCKGMIFTFDFIDFSDNIAKKYEVKDIWGNTVDIRDVELILTASMLKLWQSYNSLDDYLSNCNKNGYSFAITKYTPEKLENERALNYQFIQSLYLNDNDIDKLIEPTVKEIKEVLGEDYRKSILFLKGIHLDDMNFDKDECDFIKALMINKDMIKDPFVRNRIHFMIKKRITEAKIGVLNARANYSTISGDPYSLCQSIFNMEVTGLLGRGEFYNKHWNDLNVNKVACFRAPMTCHNNIRILNLKNNKEVNYWYKYMPTVTIFNSWDTTSHALNGADYDADAVYLTDNKVILNSIRATDAIICVQKSAKKCIPTREDFIESNKNGFGDDIGTITNHITSMFDVLANFKEGSKEYNEVMKRIMCGQNYQQNAIDKIKGIQSKEMPKSWYDYWSNKGNDFGKKIVANKNPYFFIYNYKHKMNDYKKYIDKANRHCRFTYGMSINELESLESKSEEQEKYLYYYYLKMPVSLSPSVMNKICWKIEDEFNGIKTKFNNTKFDYTILKSNKKYSRGRYSAIYKIYTDYLQKVQNQKQLFYKQSSDEEQIMRSIFKESFKAKAYEKCNDSEELCNIVLDICYKNNDNKQFAWDICGDVIIQNLLKKSDYKISYPIEDENGDIEYAGKKFRMITEVVNEDYIE